MVKQNLTLFMIKVTSNGSRVSNAVAASAPYGSFASCQSELLKLVHYHSATASTDVTSASHLVTRSLPSLAFDIYIYIYILKSIEGHS